MRRMTRWNLLGREVRDGAGLPVGEVVDTFPWDGGGEVELAIVRLDGRFGGRRMLPVEDLSATSGGALRSPFLRWQIEDSPELSSGRHAVEDPDRAKGHWRFEEPATFYAAA